MFRFRSDPSGSVLILVVWTMALLAFFAVSAGAMGGFSLKTAARLDNSLRTYAAARSAVPYALSQIEKDDKPLYDGFKDPLLRDGTLFSAIPAGDSVLALFYETRDPYSFQKTRVSGIMDEERKLNLNSADIETLTNLFHIAGGIDYLEARVLAGRVADWRDEDNEKDEEDGAEKYEYQLLEKAYPCKNAPFESVEELLLVYEFPAALYRKIRYFVTVYGTGKVNLNTAEPVVLEAMGISEAGVDALRLYYAGEDAQAGTEDDRAVASVDAAGPELSGFLSAEDLVVIARLIKEDKMDVRSEAFSFYAEAKVSEPDFSFLIHAVVHRNGEILAWQEI